MIDSAMPRTFRWILVFGFLAVVVDPSPARAEIVERIVAVVNKRIILLSDLSMRLREYLPQLARIRDPQARQQQFTLLKRRELEKLVDSILIEEEGKKRKLRVTMAEVEKAIKTVLAQNKLTLAELVATLAQEGYPFSSYRADLSSQILRLKTINLAVRSRISVSWTEVRAHYQKTVAQMGVGLRLQIRQIFLRVEASGAGGTSLARQQGRARAFIRQLRLGKTTFADLARRVSDDPESRKRGGLIGWVRRGSLPAQVESAVFGIKGVKKLVGPISTDSGLYIVYLQDRKESEALPFNKIKRRLKAKLYNLRAAKRTRAWVKTLRQRALIDYRL